jgi:hypothetical protein
MAAGDRLLSRVTIDELRTMLREDVQAVVRAELESMGAGISKDPPPAPEPQMLSPLRIRKPSMRYDDGAELRENLALQGGPDVTKALLEPARASRRMSQIYDDDELGAVSRMAGDMWPGMPQFLRKAAGSIDTFLELREEKREGCFARFVQGGSFQAFFAMVIFANAAVMVYLADVEMEEQMEKLEGKHTGDRFHDQHVFGARAEIFFLALYCVELICKLVVHRLYYFWNEDAKWNWLDFLLILQSLTETILTPLLGGGGGKSATWMRTLRLFRVAKVLRILRVIKFFTQLHLIVTCIVGSFLSLFWSVAVLALLFLLFSLYFTSTTVTYLQDSGVAPEEVENIQKFFGSVTTCGRTLFMTITGGDDWNTFYFILQPMGAAGFVYCFFVAFSHIALLNIVTGIFVESALKIAEPDVHTKAQEEINQKRDYADGLKRLLLKADKDQNRMMSRDEFQTLLQEGTLHNYLSFLGIDPIWIEDNIERLFQQMTEEAATRHSENSPLKDGPKDEPQVSLQRFVETCMKLRGPARSTDLQDLQVQVGDLDRVIREHLAGGLGQRGSSAST